MLQIEFKTFGEVKAKCCEVLILANGEQRVDIWHGDMLQITLWSGEVCEGEVEWGIDQRCIHLRDEPHSVFIISPENVKQLQVLKLSKLRAIYYYETAKEDK